jgi:hypothetical protein
VLHNVSVELCPRYLHLARLQPKTGRKHSLSVTLNSRPVVRLRALDWRRHEKNIYAKIVNWFDLMRTQLEETGVLQENVYNMDKTGVLLSVLGSSKYLVSAEMHKTHRGTGTKRTLITAVECISADGRSLPPLIIFPGVDLRSNWVCYDASG